MIESAPPVFNDANDVMPKRSDLQPPLRQVFYTFTGIINPIICFACAAPSGSWSADTPWQSGEFWVYATLMLKWPAVWPFYPLLLYSMTTLALVTWNPRRFSRRFAVRLGIYGGAILAAVFVGLVYPPNDLTLGNLARMAAAWFMYGVGAIFTLLVALGFVLSMWALLKAVRRRWGWSKPMFAALALGGAFFVAAISLDGNQPGQSLGFLLVPLIFMAAFGPGWALIAYSLAAWEVWHAIENPHWRWSIKHGLGLTAWAACLLGAWRRAMDLAVAEYATLPTENPNCFVCTAAARGHRWLVKSEAIRANNRAELRINAQLRVLKAAELALMTTAPRTHRILRKIYNRVGPPLARRLKNPWLADATYLSLKPIEWLARVALAAAGVRRDTMARIYTNH